MTVLVTGATGNVGRPLVEQLVSEGYRVRALSRRPAHAPRSRRVHVEHACGRLRWVSRRVAPGAGGVVGDRTG
nr:NAD(P)H-binding protein [Saccharomonospora iraqiensis]